MDLIRIDGLELRCIVGLRAYERRREQPIRMDIGLGLDLSGPGRSGRIAESADYAQVADEVTALLRFREYRLLEVAAEEAAALLFGCHPQLQQVRLRIDKPEALAGRARSAAVEITRSRGAYGSSLEATPYGRRVELLREREALVEVLYVDAGSTLTLPGDARRLECVVGGRKGDRGLAPVELREGQESSYQAEAAELALCRCVVLAPTDGAA
jgi:dihydroneopterin aldolase